MHVTIIDSIYLSRIRNYIVGYQNVACGGCVEGLDRVAWGLRGIVAGIRVWVGCLGYLGCGLGATARRGCDGWGVWGVGWVWIGRCCGLQM